MGPKIEVPGVSGRTCGVPGAIPAPKGGPEASGRPFGRHFGHHCGSMSALFLLHVLAVVLLYQVLLFFLRSTMMLAFFLRFWRVAVWHLGVSSEVPSFSSDVSGFVSAVLGFSSGVSVFSADICFGSVVLGLSSVAPGL